MRTDKQKGNAAIVALLVLILVAVVGFGGYYVYNSNKKKDTTTASTATPTNIVAAESVTTTFRSLESTVSVSFTHPKSWEVKQGISTTDSGTSLLTGSIRSEKGNYLLVNDVTGIGGACEPNNDALTLEKRIATTNPNIVFSQYSFAAQTDKYLTLEDFTNPSTDKTVAAMKEGDIIRDTCKVTMFPVAASADGTGPFVVLRSGPDASSKQLTYEQLAADAELLQVVKSLTKK